MPTGHGFNASIKAARILMKKQWKYHKHVTVHVRCLRKAAAVVRLAASGCIDDKTNIACFAVFARQKNGSLSGRRRNSPTNSYSASIMQGVTYTLDTVLDL